MHWKICLSHQVTQYNNKTWLSLSLLCCMCVCWICCPVVTTSIHTAVHCTVVSGSVIYYQLTLTNRQPDRVTTGSLTNYNVFTTLQLHYYPAELQNLQHKKKSLFTVSLSLIWENKMFHIFIDSNSYDDTKMPTIIKNTLNAFPFWLYRVH